MNLWAGTTHLPGANSERRLGRTPREALFAAAAALRIPGGDAREVAIELAATAGLHLRS